MITLEQAASFLLDAQDVLVLCHRYPDGDTLGSAYALVRALQQLGKRAGIACSHEPGRMYRFLETAIERQSFEPRCVVAVDVAAPSMLGEPVRSKWGERVDLCLDHHASRQEFARMTYVEPDVGAAAEVILRLLPLLGVAPDREMAACLYTALVTDTRGFRTASTSPRTLRMAAGLLETGIDGAGICRRVLDVKSRGFFRLQGHALRELRFSCGGRCAVLTVTRELMERYGVRDDETEGLPPLARRVEGVLAGVTLREKENGDFRVSVRTAPQLDAAAICAVFGGGGHHAAAGCTIHRPRGKDPAGQAAAMLERSVEDALRAIGIDTKEECE